MPKGPAGNKRLTTIGPFTYDQKSPPQLPSDFSPPDDITNALGEMRWWKRWEGEPLGNYGATMLYDPEEDRMFIENRHKGPEGNGYLHDDMVADIIESSPFAKFPDVVIPAEGGYISINRDLRGSVEIPTAAGGAFVMTQRLGDKEIVEDGEKVSVNQFYKFVYTLKLIDFPETVLVQAKHKLGPRANTIFEAERTFSLGEAYKELSFDGMLPESKVSPDS